MPTAVMRIAALMLGCLVSLLALLGIPLALVVILLFRRRLLSSPRPGRLGLEDVLRRAYRLSATCGAVMVVLVALGLIIAHVVGSTRMHMPPAR